MLNERIYIDLFRPLKSSEKRSKFILTITNAASKYAEAVAIPNKEVTMVAKSIFINWILECPNKYTLTEKKNSATNSAMISANSWAFYTAKQVQLILNAALK